VFAGVGGELGNEDSVVWHNLTALRVSSVKRKAEVFEFL